MAIDTSHTVNGITLYVYGDTSAEIGGRPWHLAMVPTTVNAVPSIQLGSHLTREGALAAMWDLRDVLDSAHKRGMTAGILAATE